MHWEKKICIRITIRRLVGAILVTSVMANLIIVGAVFAVETDLAAPTITLMLTTPVTTILAPSTTSTSTEAISFTVSPTDTVMETSTATPTETSIDPFASTPTTCLPPKDWVIYIVKPGDNLFQIGLAIGVSAGELQSANCLSSNQIFAGQSLYVPRLLPTWTPTTVVPYPDLVVSALEISGAVEILPEEQLISVPVYAVIKNQGNSAADIFKLAAQYAGPAGKFVAPFVVSEESDSWYPYTSAPLPAGQQTTIQGLITIPDALQGQTIAITVLADSCSGEESMPGFCRVVESNEGNNESQPAGINLPSNRPPVVSITVPDADITRAFDQDPQSTNYWSVVVELSGSAIDAEDGVLAGSSLVWSTDRTDLDIYKNNPILGTGNSITATLFVLPYDCRGHTITLTATDSNRNAVVATRKIGISCIN